MLLGAIGRRQPVPDRIMNAPELWQGLELYYEAFSELSTCRPFVGMNGSPGPIPFLAIDRYAERLGISDEDFDYFRELVRRLDDAFIRYMKEGEKNGGDV